MENKKMTGDAGVTEFGSVRRWKIDRKKCTVCGECIDACSRSLLSIVNEEIDIKPEEMCNQCGDCAAACAYYAIVLT